MDGSRFYETSFRYFALLILLRKDFLHYFSWIPDFLIVRIEVQTRLQKSQNLFRKTFVCDKYTAFYEVAR